MPRAIAYVYLKKKLKMESDQNQNLCSGDGDPLTPSWPSIKGAFRNSVNNAPGLPGNFKGVSHD